MTDLSPEALSTLLGAIAQPGPDTIARRFELGRRLLKQQPHRSLRALERASKGRLSRAYLHRCVAAFRLGTSFPFLLHSRLRVSHLDAVERLPRPSQGRLLREAERGGWSVRQLRQYALEARGAGLEGRLVASTQRAVRQLRESLNTLVDQDLSNRREQRVELVEIHQVLQEVLGLSQMLMVMESRTLDNALAPEFEASSAKLSRASCATNAHADVPLANVERKSVHYLGVRTREVPGAAP